MNYTELTSSVLTMHVAAPVVPEGCIEIGTSMVAAKKRLEDRGFDHALIRQDGVVIGLVDRAALADTNDPLQMGPLVRRLMLEDVIPDRTPMEDLIRYLARQPFNVVVRGKEVVGVVDASDLNKNPTYTYLYVLLSVLEQHFLALVQRLPVSTDWKSLIGAERWEERMERLAGAARDNHQLDPVYYLFFADYLKIIGSQPSLLSRLGFTSKNKWNGQVGSLDGFRNDVMHPVRNLVGSHRSVPDLFAIDQRIRGLIERLSEILSTGTEIAP